jgi:uncharacterized RDD family membrane protein YckC
LMALGYDVLLLAALSLFYGALVVAASVAALGVPEAGKHITWPLPIQWLVCAGWIFVIVNFYVYFWRKSGQTLGMKTWHIQLIDSGTQRLPTTRQCLIRSAVGAGSLLCLGAGYWYRWLHPQKRLLHDVCSHTQLILVKTK